MINELRFLAADIDGTLVNEQREMLDLTKCRRKAPCFSYGDIRRPIL